MSKAHRRSAITRTQRSRAQAPVAVIVCFALALALNYLNAVLDIGSLQVVGGYTFVACALIIVGSWHVRDYRHALPFLAALIILAALPTVLAVIRGLHPQTAALSAALLSMSLICGFAARYAVLHVGRHLGHFCFLAMAALLVVLAISELSGLTRDISDDFRHWFYAGRFVYEADARDIALYGAVRPKVFSQEPSHLAKLIGYLLLVAACLSQTPRQRLTVIFAFMISMFVVDSPTLIAALGLSLITMTYAVLLQKSYSVRSLNILLFLGGLLVVLVATRLELLSAVLGTERGARLMSGADSSTVNRMLVPPQLFMRTLRDYGWTGTGLGSIEQLHSTLYELYAQFPRYYGFDDLARGQHLTWTNAFYDVLVYLGPVFGPLFISIVAVAFFGRHWGLGFAFFIGVFMLDAGLPSTRNWFYLGLCAGAVSLGLRAARVEHAPVARGRLVARTSRPQFRPHRGLRVLPGRRATNGSGQRGLDA